jgi:hypothetical protein
MAGVYGVYGWAVYATLLLPHVPDAMLRGLEQVSTAV